MLLDELYKKIFTYLYFKTNDKYLAEDLTQETFFKYFRQKNYINNKNCLPLLYTIARNLHIDYYKKNNKNNLYYDDKDCNENNSYYANEVNLNKIMVEEAINLLSDKEREILLLKFYNELKINDIAKILNISRFSVYRSINKSLKILKNNLRKEDFF